VRDYQVKKELLLAGMGWARIPMYLVSNAINEGRLSEIQIERFNNRNRIPIYIIRLKDRTLSQVAAAFWQKMTG
ncbi:MAG: LysR substrate-binding domain-containing protein, partial [Neptuniibacter sp.]